MDYGFRRPREPWEASDGAARALAALADGAAPAAVPDFLPALAEAAHVDHFRRCRQLQATVWRVLPRIFHGLGKRARARPHGFRCCCFVCRLLCVLLLWEGSRRANSTCCQCLPGTFCLGRCLYGAPFKAASRCKA